MTAQTKTPLTHITEAGTRVNLVSSRATSIYALEPAADGRYADCEAQRPHSNLKNKLIRCRKEARFLIGRTDSAVCFDHLAETIAKVAE